MRSTPWWIVVLVFAVPLTAAPGAEAKKFRYASGPRVPADTTLAEGSAYLDPVVRSRGPRVPFTNLQILELVADRAAERALSASPLDTGMVVTLAPAREHPMNFVLEDGLVQALSRRGVEVIVRRSPVPDDSLRLLASPAPDPLLEYSTGSGKVSYLRLVGYLPGRVRIERQGLVQGALTLRDPVTARVLWAQDLGDNLIDRFSRSEVSVVEDDRYPELKSPVPSRNVDKVVEPVIAVAVVGGLVALFFQNRP